MDIYVLINGEQAGPFPEEDIRSRLKLGELVDSTPAWRDGLQDWQPISSLLASMEPLPEHETATEGKIETHSSLENPTPQSIPKPAPMPPTAVELKTAGKEKERFGSKLRRLGKAAFQEAKRNAHLAALKAKIEKAKHYDLFHAHQALGRKCYEMKIMADQFEPDYQDIADLEKRIAEKRHGVESSVNAATIERVKIAAQNTAARAEAEAFVLKLHRLFAKLGEKAVRVTLSSPDISDELEKIRQVHAHLRELEGEYSQHAAIRPTKGSFRQKTQVLVVFLAVTGIVLITGLLMRGHTPSGSVSNSSTIQSPPEEKPKNESSLSLSDHTACLVATLQSEHYPEVKKNEYLKGSIRFFSRSEKFAFLCLNWEKHSDNLDDLINDFTDFALLAGRVDTELMKWLLDGGFMPKTNKISSGWKYESGSMDEYKGWIIVAIQPSEDRPGQRVEHLPANISEDVRKDVKERVNKSLEAAGYIKTSGRSDLPSSNDNDGDIYTWGKARGMSRERIDSMIGDLMRRRPFQTGPQTTRDEAEHMIKVTWNETHK